jgi:hypothetical protein
MFKYKSACALAGEQGSFLHYEKIIPRIRIAELGERGPVGRL